MAKSDYYAFRRGAQRPTVEYPELQRLMAAMFKGFENGGWFQAKLGKDCADDRSDIGAVVLERLSFDCWPFSDSAAISDEEWVFTIIEFAYANASKPVESFSHAWDNCGIHVTRSDDEAGRRMGANLTKGS